MKAKTRKILIISGAVVLALIAIRLMFTRNTLPFGAFLLGAMALAYQFPQADNLPAKP